MLTNELYDLYRQKMQQIADIKYAAAVLQWDQETYMPAGGASLRSRQLATLSEIAHERNTDDSLWKILDSLSDRSDLTNEEAKNIELSAYDYHKQKKYNTRFVRKLSETSSRAFQHWVEARKKNDFKLFESDLDELIQLKLEEADLLGYENHPYDALLNDHDRGAHCIQNDRIFEGLKTGLTRIYNLIREQPVVDDGFLKKHIPKDQQWNFGVQVLKLMGFDFQTGRKDIAAHPFTINFGSTDVRVTTRIDENDFCNMLFSTIHEGGHALYEQGLPENEYGLPLGEPASFTVHESQSRLWENNICKSLSFWEFYYPELVSCFPAPFHHIPLESFYKAINKVEASGIRTESDEVTYHFHVLIRYEIEKALLSKEISARDIPSVWNENYLKYLGIRVDSDANGCLQDVHWSHGSFGYFSTYTLGSAMAAQLHQSIIQENIAKYVISTEEIVKIRFWLRKNLFIFGRAYTTDQLCKKITGENLNINHLLNYLEKKYLIK
jgi:carboxypeptidase Taq